MSYTRTPEIRAKNSASMMGKQNSLGSVRTEEQSAKLSAARVGQQHGLTHGMSDTPTYNSWEGMKQRCTNPKATNYSYYGGRGITYCPEWETFAAFLADMGERPSVELTLDRFPNPDGNYEPGNCRWATAKEQINNRRKKAA